MTALFDRHSNLVGWVKDAKHIFDINMNWIAFTGSNLSVWTVRNKTWVGHLHGDNFRDINGKTAFWNPKTRLQNSLKPMKPLKPLTPLTPLKPLKPLTPLRPLQPLTPLGGWSDLDWDTFMNM